MYFYIYKTLIRRRLKNSLKHKRLNELHLHELLTYIFKPCILFDIFGIFDISTFVLSINGKIVLYYF